MTVPCLDVGDPSDLVSFSESGAEGWPEVRFSAALDAWPAPWSQEEMIFTLFGL